MLDHPRRMPVASPLLHCATRITALLLVASFADLATAAEFIPLGIPIDAENTVAREVSDDGAVVIGILDDSSTELPHLTEAYRWTKGTGVVGLSQPGFKDTFVNTNRSLLSGDGKVTVGWAIDEERDERFYFYHHDDAGMQRMSAVTRLPDVFGDDGTLSPTALSQDGSIVVGGIDGRATLWSDTHGAKDLGMLSGHTSSAAQFVSNSGSIVVGSSRNASDEAYYRWSESEGMERLVRLDPASYFATAMDDYGQTLVGDIWWNDSEAALEAGRWTEATGLVGLGFLPGTELEDGRKRSVARGVSADGGAVIGYSGDGSISNRVTANARAFLWTNELGMLDLQQYAVDNFDLGEQLAGWNLKYPQDISPDGRVIVGSGVNPDGRLEGWLLRLDGAAVPEPLSAVLAVLAFAPLATARFRRIGGTLALAMLGLTTANLATAGEFYHVPDATMYGNPISSDASAILLGGVGADRIWRPFADSFIELPTDFSGLNISADGSTVVGFANGLGAFWTEEAGAVTLGLTTFDQIPSGVSQDGSVIYGLMGHPDTGRSLFQWTEAAGVIDLGVPLGHVTGGRPYSVSHDGLRFASVSSYLDDASFVDDAYRWTSGLGFQSIGPAEVVWDMSAGGETIVGWTGAGEPREAYRWQETSGMVGLGIPDGWDESGAEVVSADGSLVLGALLRDDKSDRGLFVWSEPSGMVDLEQILFEQLGLEFPDGPDIRSPVNLHGISADHRTIVGSDAFIRNGIPYDGAWVAVLDQPLQSFLVPEPAAALLAVLAAVPLATRRTVRSRL